MANVWAYKIVRTPFGSSDVATDEELEAYTEELNLLGAEGWELVAVERLADRLCLWMKSNKALVVEETNG